MRTSPLLLALSLAVAATPMVALAGNDGAPGHDKPPTNERAQGPKGTHHLLHACVTTDAVATGVALKVLGGNRHMRDVLDGATTFTAKLDAATVVRLVGKARFPHEGGDLKKLPKVGTSDDLDAGDRVIVRFRAERGLAADALPAAYKLMDRGPSAACAPETAPPPVEEQPPAL